VTSSPHYFGRTDAPLFGCFHPPARGGPKRGVLICNAMGHEYMASFRTVRQTAVRLARAGAPALRFDFYGSGDSAGESSDGCPSRWAEDIGVAVDELRKRQGAAEVSIVGLRLGAALALQRLQEAQPLEARALILWDPVILGKAYVAELLALQRERFGRSSDDEVLGFPFNRRLRAELEAIDLSAIGRPRTKDVLIVETGGARPATRALADRLRDLGSAVEHRTFDDGAIWHEPNKSAVAANIVQAIVTWTSARC
jgi:pimeloyl-ACP methyl ester carboxylesterase